MSQHFAIIAWDAPGSDAARKEMMKAHLDHFERGLDKIAIAGPLRDADGNSAGSLLIVKAETPEEVHAIMAADPYHAAGIWSKIEVLGFRAAAGEWIGGKTW